MSAVCHGPAALLLATDAEGNSILKGKRVSVFTIKEAALMNGSNVRIMSSSGCKYIPSLMSCPTLGGAV